MSVSGGKISAPVGVEDPYNCMGVEAAENGYDVGYICGNSHGKTNRFSKRKPYRSPILGLLYGADGTDDSTIKQLNYGLTPVYIDMGTFGSAQPALGELTWTDGSTPTGGESGPYRLADFEGYNHSAVQYINKVSFLNNVADSAYPTRPIFPTDSDMGKYSLSYTCRIDLDPLADINLADCYSDGYNFGELRYTLVLGGNDGGLMAGNFKMVQSEGTVEEYRNEASVFLEIDLSNEPELKAAMSNGWIAAVFVATDLTTEQLANGMFPTAGYSLNMWADDGVGETCLYGTEIGEYGDTSTGGGSIPKTDVEGTWSLESEPILTYSDEEYQLYIGFVTLTITNGGSAGNEAYIELTVLDTDTREILAERSLNNEADGGYLFDTSVGSWTGELFPVGIGTLAGENSGEKATQIDVKLRLAFTKPAENTNLITPDVYEHTLEVAAAAMSVDTDEEQAQNEG